MNAVGNGPPALKVRKCSKEPDLFGRRGDRGVAREVPLDARTYAAFAGAGLAGCAATHPVPDPRRKSTRSSVADGSGERDLVP